MNAHEMATYLLGMADKGCTKTFGAEAYTCREYDAAAMYDSSDAVCERCQALDALDRLRAPHVANERVLLAALRDIGKAIERANKAVAL